MDKCASSPDSPNALKWDGRVLRTFSNGALILDHLERNWFIYTSNRNVWCGVQISTTNGSLIPDTASMSDLTDARDTISASFQYLVGSHADGVLFKTNGFMLNKNMGVVLECPHTFGYIVCIYTQKEREGCKHGETQVLKMIQYDFKLNITKKLVHNSIMF